MRLQHEADLRASSKHAPDPVYADQLDEWLKETSVPYTPDDNFSQTGIFEYWHSKTSKYPDLARLECGNNSMLALHLVSIPSALS